MKTIVFDVDGVLADFSAAFTFLAAKTFGTTQISDLSQTIWDYTGIMTEDQKARTWEVLKKIPEWWTTFLPLVSLETFRRIEFLTVHNEVYFVTNRFSDIRPPGEQTLTWLKCRGISDPRVIVSSRKGEIASALNATHALEDNWQNASVIHWMASGCRTFLIKRGYNEKARQVIPKGITVVDSVGDFLNQI